MLPGLALCRQQFKETWSSADLLYWMDFETKYFGAESKFFMLNTLEWYAARFHTMSAAI